MANRTKSFSIDRFRDQIAQEGGFSRSFLFTCRVAFSVDSNFKYWNTTESQYLLCRSVSLPAAIVDTVELKYFTRSVKIPGGRTFPPLSLTFYSTNQNPFRTLLLDWQESLSAPISNIRGIDEGQTLDFSNDGSVSGFITADPLNYAISSKQNAYRNALFADIYLTQYNIEPEKRNLALIAANLDALSGNSPLGQTLGQIGGVISGLLNPSDHVSIGTYHLRGAWPTSIGSPTLSHDSDDIQTYDVEFSYQDMSFIPAASVTTSQVFRLP